MGKRSNFERRERDFYPTPYAAVLPLLPYLPANTQFCEPCAGDGALIDHLARHGHNCVTAGDIEPRHDDIDVQDALQQTESNVDCFITNPPWTRDTLHPIIEHLSDIAPAWLLFDADWSHTKQSALLMLRCRTIVSVGRVKWIADSKFSGKDNAAWHLFDKPNAVTQTVFIGRAA